jgi:DNA (cytosine-5)-methyltransferase 1
VLSLFSGVGSLDEGFRRAGFCVVSAGDVAWSSLFDLRNFHPPQGVFDGVIGGDPCQSHSALANLVRAKGLEPSFPDLTPEFCRVIEEAQPRWFLRENVPRAPEIKPLGYAVKSFLLDHSTLDSGDGTGHEQMRRRRFWFGMRGDTVPELRAYIDFALNVLPDPALTVDTGHDKLDGAKRIAARRQAVLGRHHGSVGAVKGRKGSDVRYTIDEMLDLQGLPRDIFEHSPLTMQGKRKLIGNAVPLPMAEALGRAVAGAVK